MQCPQCGNELRPDPSNQGKVLCDTCKKRFSESAVNEYWSRQQPVVQQPVTTPEPVVEQPQPQPQAVPVVPPQNVADMPAPQPMQQYPTPQVMPVKLPKGLAIAALIIGILAVLGCWVPVVNIVNAILGIVGLILGIVAVKKVKKGTGSGKGLAIGGIITSILAIVFSIVITVVTCVFAVNYLDEYDIDIAEDPTAYLSDELTNGEGIELIEDYDLQEKASPDAVPGEFDWDNTKVILDGKTIEVGKTKVSELIKAGWEMNDEDAKETLDKKESMLSVALHNDKYERATMFVSLANDTSKPLKSSECIIRTISLSTYDMDNVPEFKLDGADVELGMNYYDALVAFGCEDQSNEYVGTAGYRNMTYSNMNEYVDITSAEDELVTEISMKIY